jgi:hypothetical protein
VEFWDMTPREIQAAIEADIWRRELVHRRDAWLAWHVAALSRAKRLPPLQRMLGGGQTRELEGEELERRRREHQEIMEKIDVQKINEALKHGR